MLLLTHTMYCACVTAQELLGGYLRCIASRDIYAFIYEYVAVTLKLADTRGVWVSTNLNFVVEGHISKFQSVVRSPKSTHECACPGVASLPVSRHNSHFTPCGELGIAMGAQCYAGCSYEKLWQSSDGGHQIIPNSHVMLYCLYRHSGAS